MCYADDEQLLSILHVTGRHAESSVIDYNDKAYSAEDQFSGGCN